MPSIKNLKKDINFLTEEVIAASLFFYNAQGVDKARKEQLEQIIEEMVKLRNESIDKINNNDFSDKKEQKAYYRDIFDTILEKVNESFEKLK